MACRRGYNPESGFALLFVFAMSAAVAAMLYMELPRVAHQAQREREELLIARGEQYKRAIQLFVRKNNRYPATLDDLDKAGNIRYLRRRYKDPMTGKDEWRLVHVGPGGALTDSIVQKQETEGEKKEEGTQATVAMAGDPNLEPAAPAPGMPRRPSDVGLTYATIEGSDETAQTMPPAEPDPQAEYLTPGQPAPPSALQAAAGQQPIAGPYAQQPPQASGQIPGADPQTGVVFPQIQERPAFPQAGITPENQAVPPGQQVGSPGFQVTPSYVQPGPSYPAQSVQQPAQQGSPISYPPPPGQAGAYGQVFGSPNAQGAQQVNFYAQQQQTQPGSSINYPPPPGQAGIYGQVTQSPYVNPQAAQPVYQQGQQGYAAPQQGVPVPPSSYIRRSPLTGGGPQRPRVSGSAPAFPYSTPAAPGAYPGYQGGVRLPMALQQNPTMSQGPQPPARPGPTVGRRPPNTAMDMINRLLTTPRPGGLSGVQGQRTGGQVIGGGIAGVASTLEAEAIKVYNDRSKYNEWEFIYDISKDPVNQRQMVPQGLGSGTNRPGAPQQGAGPQLPGGPPAPPQPGPTK